MTTVPDSFAAGLGPVRRSWRWFLALGIVLIALGVLCVGKAQTATTFSVAALGWILAISGLVWLVNAFRAFNWQGFFLFLLNAIIRWVIGYLLLRHPAAGAEGVTMLLATLFIVTGLFRAVGAGAIRFPRWGWVVFSGILSCLLGVVLLASWPSISPYFLGMVVGIDLIFDGAALISLATTLRSLPEVEIRRAA